MNLESRFSPTIDIKIDIPLFRASVGALCIYIYTYIYIAMDILDIVLTNLYINYTYTIHILYVDKLYWYSRKYDDMSNLQYCYLILILLFRYWYSLVDNNRFTPVFFQIIQSPTIPYPITAVNPMPETIPKSSPSGTVGILLGLPQSYAIIQL